MDSGGVIRSKPRVKAAGVVTTSDGGATRQLRHLDVPVPQLYYVSCSGARWCWLFGEEAVPEHVGNSYDGGSAERAMGVQPGQRPPLSCPKAHRTMLEAMPT
jgi:hypothetical protein